MGPEENRQTTEVNKTVDADTGAVRQETVQRNTNKAPIGVVLKRIVIYVAGVVIALLALRVVLLLLAANDENAFVNFIYGVSGVFAAPFYGIFNYEPSYGEFTFEISSVVAGAVYALVAWGLAKLFTLTSSRG